MRPDFFTLRWRHVLLANLLWPLAATAQQAVVTTQDAAALEIGQAFLAHNGQQCYAIMPTHVVREAERPALLREGSPVLLGETHGASDLGDDIGIAMVSGGITAECGVGALTIRRSISPLLQQGRLATLRSINGDGTVAQLSVTIVDDDGRGLLRVQPTHPDNPIRKGLSGSLLMIDGVSTGMLLSVHAKSGIGTVARIDALMSKVDAYLMNRASLTLSNSTALGKSPVKKTVSTGLKLQVLAWSALPLDDSRRAVNLTANDDAPPWASKPTRWPVSIDLKAGEDVVVVTGLELDGRGVTNSGTLPAQIEVSMNLSGDARGWRVVTSETVSYRDGIAHISIAPTRSRLIRLSFGSTANGGQVISLRRVVLRQD